MRSARIMLFIAAMAIGTGMCFGQNMEFDRDFIMEMSAFGGAGLALTSRTQATHGEVQAGADIRFLFPSLTFPAGLLFEFGYADPTNNHESGSALISTDYVAPFVRGKSSRLLLFGAAGYTRLIASGNAINYGAGVDIPIKYNHAVRVELRDYWNLTGLKGHNAALRVGFLLYGTTH